MNHVTHQRHAALLPIDEIDNVALWVLGAEVDEHEHDLLPDDVRPHVEEVDGQVRVELEVDLPGERVRAARLEAHEPEDRPGGRVVEPGQAVHRKGKKTKIKKGDMEGGKHWGTRERGRGRGRRNSGGHLRTETTRSSSSMENACVIAIEPRG